MSKRCIDSYNVDDWHYEIWDCDRTFSLVFSREGYLPEVRRFASAASARRAMYKIAWDFHAFQALRRSEFYDVL